jgi:hypothetical protein
MDSYASNASKRCGLLASLDAYGSPDGSVIPFARPDNATADGDCFYQLTPELTSSHINSAPATSNDTGLVVEITKAPDAPKTPPSKESDNSLLAADLQQDISASDFSPDAITPATQVEL